MGGGLIFGGGRTFKRIRYHNNSETEVISVTTYFEHVEEVGCHGVHHMVASFLGSVRVAVKEGGLR